MKIERKITPKVLINRKSVDLIENTLDDTSGVYDSNWTINDKIKHLCEEYQAAYDKIQRAYSLVIRGDDCLASILNIQVR